MKFIPTGGRILIKLEAPPSEAEEEILGGIIVPDSHRKKVPGTAVVVALGDGSRSPTWDIVPHQVKKGDRVRFLEGQSLPIDIEGVEYLLISEDSILGILS